MAIPHAELAYVSAEKLLDYLLDPQHPVGGSKARWFHSIGYDSTKPEVLDQDLCNLVRETDDFIEKTSPFGVKYVVAGKVTAPDGQEVNLTTVWIVDTNDNRPRLVTAYPGDKS